MPLLKLLRFWGDFLGWLVPVFQIRTAKLVVGYVLATRRRRVGLALDPGFSYSFFLLPAALVFSQMVGNSGLCGVVV